MHHVIEPPTAPPHPPLRKRYSPPRVRCDEVAEAPLLLCTTGRPYVCEGGYCCDSSPGCDYWCNGG